MNYKPLGILFVRLAVYTLFMLFILEVIKYDAASESPNGLKFYENAYTEVFQEVFLFVGAVLSFLTAWRTKKLRAFLLAAGTFFLMSFFREFNNFLNNNVFESSWQIFVYGTFLPFFIYAIRNKNWQRILQDLINLTPTFAFGVLISGFIIVFVFSRIYGLHGIWIDILGDNYIRDIKNISEEATELLGYTFMFIGLLEVILLAHQKES